MVPTFRVVPAGDGEALTTVSIPGFVCHRTHLEEGVHVEQEYRSFDQRHFLEYGIQN